MYSNYRASWKDYIERMDSSRISNKLLHYRPHGKRNLGTPLKRWSETVNRPPGLILDECDDDDDALLIIFYLFRIYFSCSPSFVAVASHTISLACLLMLVLMFYRYDMNCADFLEQTDGQC
jgi:hypothetical protein